MKNDYFEVKVNPDNGMISKILFPSDPYMMNWVADDGFWGGIHYSASKRSDPGHPKNNLPNKELSLLDAIYISEDKTVYANEDMEVTVCRRFEKNQYIENYKFKNLRNTDLFTEHGEIGILLPFNDMYTYAEDCMSNRCNTHLWCAKNTTYVNALRMGKSDSNLGLVLTQGSIESYSVYNAFSNHRGCFVLNLGHLELTTGEEYVIEWRLFEHKGNEDFFVFARQFEQFIEVKAPQFTVFENENIEFSVNSKKEFVIYCEDEKIPVNNGKVFYKPKHLGKHRFYIYADKKITYADFHVSAQLEVLVKKRVDFIVKNQQYKKKNSPLLGAFLIFDNEEKYCIFDSVVRDHNACRERMSMALLIIKYLQKHHDEEVYQALNYFIEFLFREMVDVETGEVFDGIRKNAKYKRLYNAPWITTLFCEMYLLTKDTNYLVYTMRILRHYYTNGGTKFYPNGLSMRKTLLTLLDAGMNKQYDEALKLFTAHTENMVSNGIKYPKHEVNFEQTIVSPAATFISEMASVTKNEKYKEEAEKHIETLLRFSGMQPSFHLNEIPIRYWDDYWFGKSRLFGDTFPHYWSCLSSRAFSAFYHLTKNEEYRKKSERCIRNCLCLFNEKGEGSCAYIYPFKVNGEKGAFYDQWANDQDFALYFYLETQFNYNI